VEAERMNMSRGPIQI